MVLRKLHDKLLQFKVTTARKVALASFAVVYPTVYFFWCFKMNEMWFKNNLRFLHPEVYHPAVKRYDDQLLSKPERSVASEIAEINEYNPDNRVETVLNNLRESGHPLLGR